MIWVIEALAETGIEISLEMLPGFLDTQTKRFLMELSERERGIRKKRGQIKDLKRRYRLEKWGLLTGTVIEAMKQSGLSLSILRHNTLKLQGMITPKTDDTCEQVLELQ